MKFGWGAPKEEFIAAQKVDKFKTITTGNVSIRRGS